MRKRVSLAYACTAHWGEKIREKREFECQPGVELGERREVILLSKKETRTFKFSKGNQVRGVLHVEFLWLGLNFMKYSELYECLSFLVEFSCF